jgi:glycosyltransferase involved in cell wall biosynthesis
MTFSLCYTSVRAKSIVPVVKLWRDRAKWPDKVEVVIAVDGWDGDSAGQAALVPRATVVAQHERPGTCVKGWNLAAEKATGDVILAIADDFIPPACWDEKLAEVGDPGWEKLDHVVKVWDGYNPDLCTLSILTKARYDRLGYVFYPGYLSLFCDTEFTEHALHEKVMVDAMHLFFEHIHPDCGKRERDMADSTHASSIRWTLGESLYHYRKSMGFPIDLGPRATRPRPAFKGELNGYAVYMQAIKDDFCMWEVCYRMMEEGVRRFFIFVPDHYWSGEPNPHEQALDLIYDLADKVRGLGGDVDVVYSPVDFKAGKNRLEVETDYRNKSLAYMWDHGVEHALVVDSDELWDHGMLEKIMPYVAESPAIQVTMVPVIGLPGYPVDGASDSAVVYVKKGNKFSMCRTPVERAVSLAFRGVVHFTGTRRSHEEIIKKMREGGHYDDPDYDFEGWIQRKLPNIKPGMKDAHMYRPYQIWPAVRDWTADEIERNMPPSIRPYLGLPVPMPERKNPSLVDMARFLNRPPCHEPTHSYYRVNVFGSPR